MHYVAIDLHKTESYSVVIDEDGRVVEEAEVPNDELDELAREYAGSEAVLEATSNYFAVYDQLSEHLDVQVANPLQMAWVTEGQKSDRSDVKQLAEVLRLGGIQESYVPPQEIREQRALVRARKKFVEQRTKYKNEALSAGSGRHHPAKRALQRGGSVVPGRPRLERPCRVLVGELVGVDR